MAVDIKCIIDGLVTQPDQIIKASRNSPHSIHRFQFNNVGLLTVIYCY